MKKKAMAGKSAKETKYAPPAKSNPKVGGKGKGMGRRMKCD